MRQAAIIRSFKRIAKICSVAVTLMGVIVLIGWYYNVPLLKSVFPNFVEMKANTALGYVLAGISLFCLSLEHRNKHTDRIGKVAALAIILIGGLTFLEYVLGLDFGIDLLLFNEPMSAIGTSNPGRMAIQSSLNFVCKGIALLILDWETRKGHRPSQYLSLFTALFPLQALIAYSYGVRNLFGNDQHYTMVTQMAIHAGISWLLLSVGTLFAVPNRGVMAMVSNPSYAGTTIRRVLIPGLILPIFIGFLLSIGANRSIYNSGFALSTLALCSVVCFSIIAWQNAKKLVRMEQGHNEAVKKSEEQIAQLQKMEAIGTLAGGVAHDFNNILAVIGLYGENILAELEAEHPLKSSAAQITKAVRRGAGLTKQLLAFSRQQSSLTQSLELNQIIMDFKKMLSRLIGEDIHLVTNLESNDWNIMADQAQIEQVIMNLVVNAKDAMPDGGTLSITTKSLYLNTPLISHQLAIPEGQYVVFTVSDSGMGMLPEIQDRIFEPFFTTKDVGKGTGLGLSTVYGILKRHKASLTVSSSINQGTEFNIYFPVAKRQPTSAIQNEMHHSLEAYSNKTILVTEDENDLRHAICLFLNEFNFTVLQARNGEEALQLIEKNSGTIDLLITDVIMPKLGGADLAQIVASKWPLTKTLFLSGYTADKLDESVILNSKYFLEKPFTFKDLGQKIYDILAEQEVFLEKKQKSKFVS